MARLLKTLSILALSLAAGLSQAAEPTAWDKIKSFAHDRKDDAVAEGQRLLAATDEKIAALKQQIAQSNGETRAAHERNMKDLQAKRKAAQAELSKMQKSAAKTWDATREGFANAYKDLHTAFEKATASK